MSQSPIPLIPEDSRLTAYPIGRQSIWNYYTKARNSFWVVNEINFADDRVHYLTRLNDGERLFVDHVLAFFAASDRIVNINIVERFRQDIPILEVQYFYDFQLAMEDIHAETYALQLETIVDSQASRERLLDAINTMPIVKVMTKWMFDTIESDLPFGERLIRMACVEGIFFTAMFCAIYWLQNRGLMPGMGHANELISRDEALHTEFAIHLYSLCSEKLTTECVHKTVDDAVTIAKQFAEVSLPTGLVEMNSTLMGKYIECVADNLMVMMGVPAKYKSKNPFAFMDQLNFDNRTNFFERRPSEYSKQKTADDDWDAEVRY